jgi:hypothetical protein
VSRRATLMGRTGTVLLAMSLDLLLVSLIPAGQQQFTSSSDQYLAASTFTYSGYPLNLNPQRGMHANITTNGELRVYVFENSTLAIIDWINTHLPDPNNYTQQEETFMLDAFLGNHTSLIGYQKNITGQAEFDYTPSEVEETTLIFANYGNTTVKYGYQLSIINTLAPSAKLQMTAAIMVLVGVILASPWIASVIKEKRGSTTRRKT